MTRTETLDTAARIVCGHREQEYGSPEDNFRKISELWSAYLEVSITPVDVAMMMGLLKIARIRSGTGTEDSFVDLAGYAACAAEIATKRATTSTVDGKKPDATEDKVVLDASGDLPREGCYRCKHMRSIRESNGGYKVDCARSEFAKRFNNMEELMLEVGCFEPKNQRKHK